MDVSTYVNQLAGFTTNLSNTANQVNQFAGSLTTIGGNLKGIEIRPIVQNPTVQVPITETIKKLAPYLLGAFLVIILVILFIKKS